jgi:hypothetical protein
MRLSLELQNLELAAGLLSDLKQFLHLLERSVSKEYNLRPDPETSTLGVRSMYNR